MTQFHLFAQMVERDIAKVEDAGLWDVCSVSTEGPSLMVSLHVDSADECIVALEELLKLIEHRTRNYGILTTLAQPGHAIEIAEFKKHFRGHFHVVIMFGSRPPEDAFSN